MNRSVQPPGFIEVELGSYCNRRCAWCPNGWSERGRERRQLPASVWRALLDDLARARYRGWLAFHNYNEPLADPKLFLRLSQARRALPRARFEVHTNGDLLNRAMLERLAAGGVDVVRVTLYPAASRAFEPPEPRRLNELFARLGLPARGRVQRRSGRLERRAWVSRLLLVARAPRISRYTDRAGSVGLAWLAAKRKRRRPCLLPCHSAAVDCHGNLKLCCHVYDSRDPANAPYVLGNVGATPFSALWASARMEDLRKQLRRARFAGLPACASCRHRPSAAKERQERDRSPRLRSGLLRRPPEGRRQCVCLTPSEGPSCRGRTAR